MGLFIANAERVARRFDAALMVIHHTGKNGQSERGSSALRAASDLMVEVKLDDSNIRVISDRDKDAGPFDTWKLHLEETGDSVAIRPGNDLERLRNHEETVLSTISESFGTVWASTAEIREVVEMSNTTLHRALKSLVDAKYVEERSVGRQKKEYRLSPENATVSNHSKPFHETVQTIPFHPPHLSGGSGMVGKGGK